MDVRDYVLIFNVALNVVLVYIFNRSVADSQQEFTERQRDLQRFWSLLDVQTKRDQDKEDARETREVAREDTRQKREQDRSDAVEAKREEHAATQAAARSGVVLGLAELQRHFGENRAVIETIERDIAEDVIFPFTAPIVKLGHEHLDYAFSESAIGLLDPADAAVARRIKKIMDNVRPEVADVLDALQRRDIRSLREAVRIVVGKHEAMVERIIPPAYRQLTGTDVPMPSLDPRPKQIAYHLQ